MVSRRNFLKFSYWALLPAVAKLSAEEPLDPWSAPELIQPAELADRLQHADGPIHIICVAFPVLYRQRHIAGAILAGPTSKPEGLQAFHSALESRNKTELIVLYCGCCPMQQCPNIRPAYLAAKKLEFKNVRVLDLAQNFHTDWAEKGYPVAEG
jgi:hypothetical protein